METRVVNHAADLGTLLGYSCADLQGNPIHVGCSSHPGQKGVRLDLHQATDDGFHWPDDGVHGEMEPEPVEVMLHSSTINQVGHICWALGLAGNETESS